MNLPPIKTCDYCEHTGAMPTFMNGETMCGACLKSLPDGIQACNIEIMRLRKELAASAGLTFDKLRTINAARCKEWNGDTPWSAADKVVEFIGEFGEACNVIKKLKRIECGMPGTDPADRDALRLQLSDELGDAQICLDLLADEVGIDLGIATLLKFNKTSDKVGFEHKLGEPERCGTCDGLLTDFNDCPDCAPF